MSKWIEDTHGQIKLPNPSGGGYGVNRQVKGSLDAGFHGQAHGPQVISGLAVGLGAVAQAADKWAGVLAQEEQTRQELLLIDEMQTLRRKSDEFISGFMAGNQGRNGTNAAKAYEAWFKNEVGALRERWDGAGTLAQQYLARRVGGIGVGGFKQMLSFGRGELEKWEASKVQGEIDYGLALAEADPANWKENLGEAEQLLARRLRRRGLSGQEIALKRRELRNGGLEAAVTALRRAGKIDEAEQLLDKEAG